MLQTQGIRAADIAEVLGGRTRVIEALDATLRASRPSSLKHISQGLDACAARVASLLNAEVLWPSGRSAPTSAETACLAFGEQWVIDVASMPETMVVELRSHLGEDGLMDFVHSLLVEEQRIRLDLAWQRLGLLASSTADDDWSRTELDESGETKAPATRSNRNGDPVLNAAMAEWQAAVVCLDQVDPITTELVRLRCANHHDCHT